jgi:hypothetical protein
VLPDQLLVLAVRDEALEAVERREPLAQDRHDLHRDRIAGRGCERRMERDVVLLPILVGDVERAHRVEPCLHVGERALRGRLGGLRRAPALDRAADLEEFADPVRLLADQLDQRQIQRGARWRRHE